MKLIKNSAFLMFPGMASVREGERQLNTQCGGCDLLDLVGCHLVALEYKTLDCGWREGGSARGEIHTWVGHLHICLSVDSCLSKIW